MPPLLVAFSTIERNASTSSLRALYFLSANVSTMPVLRAVLSRAHAMRSCTSSGMLVLPPNVFQADVVFIERGHFRLQIAAEESHKKPNFAPGTLLPVLLLEKA